MFDPPPLSAPVSPVALTLAAQAREGHLVLCTGAGLSMAADASMPSGAQLAEDLCGRLQQRLEGYEPPADRRDLLAVADAAVQLVGGLDALQRIVLNLAPFERAPTNHGHRVLAMLLLEGAVTALTWNWDDCVERGAALIGEPLRIARTHEDISSMRDPQLAKVHGCATMVSSLLITSEQLQAPPPWTERTVSDHLTTGTVVFVGIGDIADYTKRRLQQLVAELQDLRISVVSPTIRSSWAETAWAEIVGDRLSDDRKIEETADVFLDELARAWTMPAFDSVAGSCDGLSEEANDGVNRVLDAARAMPALNVLRWFRRAAMLPVSGRTAMHVSASGDALLAAGVLAASATDVSMPRPGGWHIDATELEALVVDGRASASEIRREAHRRAERLASDGVSLGDQLTFLVAGTVVGNLETPPEGDLDLLAGRADSEDIIDGPSAGVLQFVVADELLRDAA